MLTSDEVDGIIYKALEALNEERGADEQIVLSPSTGLFGVDADIDSLSFVSVITDVEASLNIDHDLDIQLADDRAMTRAQSPYDSVETLRDYILELIEGP
jgi:acyl carrier protein